MMNPQMIRCWMRTLRGVKLVTVLLLIATSMSSDAGRRAEGADGEDANGFRFLVYDGFAGKTGLNWHPVRYDPTHVSLSKHHGQLTITTQRGTIHRDEEDRGEPSAKNLYFLENPLARDTDFVITTCITAFSPESAYQQAGLICYDDDDNYLKWCYTFDWRRGSGATFSFLRETEGESAITHVPSPPDAGDVWLRLTKRGNSYEYAASADGENFTVYGEGDWGNGAPKMVGIYAKNGGPEGVPEVDACFDFFEFRSPVSD